MAKQHQLHWGHYLNRAHKGSRLATGGGGGNAEDKQQKYREQQRHKILKVFLAAVIPLTVLVLLFAPSRGGGSLTFLRSESVSAIDSAASKASTAAKLPVPASSDKSTLYKIGLFLGLQTKSPMSHPTAMPTMATPTLATPTDTPTMTPTNSLTEVHTKVLTAASTGVPTDQDGVVKDAYASSFGEPSKQELLDQPAASLVTKHIVVAHCKEDVSWLDQLHNFDQSAFDPRCKIHIHIYSKCGVVVDLDHTIPKLAHCTTNHMFKNIGTQEYVYFQYIQDMYNDLPSYVSFIQGSGITENPHIIYDLMGEELPGMTYKVLSRYVKDSRHMFGTEAGANNTTKESEIFKVYFPLLRNHRTWMTGWRGMFTVSGSKIRQNPKYLYVTLIFYLESMKCVSANCNMEVLFASLFDCNPLLGEKPNCTRGVYTNLSYPVIKEDYLKDGCNNCNHSPVGDTEWEICGRQMSIFSQSLLNGAMICLELGSEDTSGTMMNFLSKSIEGDNYKSDFSNVTWGYLQHGQIRTRSKET